MNRHVIVTILLAFSALFINKTEVKASHAAGGELIYEWVSDSTYRFIFKFYRDCGGSPEPFSVQMCYSNGCNSTTGNIILQKMSSIPTGSNGQQVSTGCANNKNTCDSPQSNIPGYREWWYSNTLTLPSRCASWKFYSYVPVRNASQNLQGTPNFYVEATLNNVVAQGNSSPTFSVKPVPYVCINQQYNYNNGGVDPNNDSMVFEVLNPLTVATGCGNTGTNVGFQTKSPVLSIPSNPFQTNNTFQISSTSGQLSFTPSELGSQTVSVRTKEYRNNVLIGSVMRDIQVQVIQCVTTTPTVNTDPTTLTGSQFINGRVVSCATKPFTFCFNVKSSDTDAVLVVTDNHNASAPGSAVTYTNVGEDSVRGCFSWTPGSTDTGTRVFAVTVKDSSCATGGVPITQTFLVPIYVWAVTKAIKDTAICIGDSVQLNAVGGTGYLWSVISGSSNSLSCLACKDPIAYPNVTTTYSVTSNSSPFCNQNVDTITVTVKNPPSPAIGSNTPVCPGGTINLTSTPASSATAFEWLGPNSFTSGLQNPSISNAQIANGGIYAVRAVIDGCTTSYSSTNVFVGYPNAPTAGSNSPVCENTPINLTASFISGTVVYNWTGPNGFTSTQQNPTITSASPASAGIYRVQADVNGCPSFFDSVTVVVHDAPDTPIANSPITYCQDVMASALTANGSNLRWYTSATGGTGSTIAPVPSTGNPGTTTYYVTQTDNNFCESDRKAIYVVVLAKPVPPQVSPVIYYCQTDTPSQLVANGTNLRWYTSATGGTGSTTAPTPSTANPGTTNYYVSQTDGSGCESDRAQISVVVIAKPSPPAVSTPVNYCQFGPNTPPLNVFVNGNNITWYTTPTGGIGNTTTPVVNTNTVGTTTFYVTQTVNTCESIRGALVVNVIAKPQPPGVSDTSLCQFSTAGSLTANGQNLLWYTSATGGTGSSTAPIPSTTNIGITRYYVSQTINGCESDRDSIDVEIKPLPIAPQGLDVSYCQFDIPTQLLAAGNNIRWYTVPTGGTGTTIPPIPSTAVADTFNWYVSQTENGCEGPRDTVTVIVKPQPASPAVSNLEYCLGVTALPLTASGQNLLWYTSGTGGTASTTAPTPSTSSVGTNSYYVSQTIDGCESPRAVLLVETDTVVTARIVFSKQPICEDDSLTITHIGAVPDSSSFTWTFGGGTVLEGDSAGPYRVKWDTAGQKTITLFANRQDCKATDTQSIYVLPVPEVGFDMVAEACIDQEVIVMADSSLQNVGTYNWATSDGTRVDSTSNSYTLKWYTAGVRYISLRTMSDTGCISEVVTDTINIRPYPIASIDSSDEYDICIRNHITLTAKQYSGYRYLWEPRSYFLNNDSSKVSARIPSGGYVILNVIDDIGCTGKDSIYVDVHLCCEINMPDAFSPNGDGKNDKFRIISGGSHTVKSFIIMNRYGQVVFETKDQNEGWDGRFNGVAQDLGTYMYYIKYTCNDDNAHNNIEKKGSVILIR